MVKPIYNQLDGGGTVLEWMNLNISLVTLICLFPITFLLYDIEEIIIVER